jgi:hypothetical protein
MNTDIWDFKGLNNKLNEEKNDINKKYDVDFDDNYLKNIQDYSAFSSVVNYLACSYDYVDKQSWKLDTMETLKEKLNNYDIGMFSNLDQKFNNISFQSPFIE